ncbi:MAG: hypothetical protein RSC48_07060, partial [Anaerorhabdus sp.]
PLKLSDFSLERPKNLRFFFYNSIKTSHTSLKFEGEIQMLHDQINKQKTGGLLYILNKNTQ